MASRSRARASAAAPFDLTAEAWTADYPDPYDFMNVLLSGDSLRDANNNNVAYFSDPKYNTAIRNASKLTGSKRYSTYGALDMDISKNAVPWADARLGHRPDLRLGRGPGASCTRTSTASTSRPFASSSASTFARRPGIRSGGSRGPAV